MEVCREQNNVKLATQNLIKYYGEFKALSEVSIEVESCITLIIGPNGSGKSTLINVVTGFLKADGGKVFLGEKEITNLPPHEIFKRGIVRTFQTSQPLLKLTVLENLLIAEANYGESIIQGLKRDWLLKEEMLVKKAFSILSLLGIEHMWNKRAMSLSGGQLRLLEIGRALMCQTKLIIMDEPIAGVAPDLSHAILKKLRELSDMGISFLIVEHRLDIVLEYVDRVYVMAEGKIISEGRSKEIFENPHIVEVYLGAQG